MAQSNISGPFNITNGLIVGGTVSATGILTAGSAINTPAGTLSAAGALSLASVVASGVVTTSASSSAGTLFTMGTHSVGWAAAKPAGGGNRGDILFNSAFAAGTCLGWACSAPGTWIVLGTFA